MPEAAPTVSLDSLLPAREALLQAVREGAGQRDACTRAEESLRQAGHSVFWRGELRQVWKTLVDEGRLTQQNRRWVVVEDGNAAARKWSAEQVLAVLKRVRHSDAQWIFLEELRLGTGFSRNSDQRMDAWAMHTYPSHGHHRVAYEVKVTRADFRQEIRTPSKRRHALLWSNVFYFVAPVGVVPREEVPPECGLLEVVGDDPETARLLTTISAPVRDSMWPTWCFVASLARRMREANEAEQLRKQVEEASRLRQYHEDRIRDLELSLGALRGLVKQLGYQSREAFATLAGLAQTDLEKGELVDQLQTWRCETDRELIALVYPDLKALGGWGRRR